MSEWRFVGHCFDGAPFAIDGIDVWRTWTPTGERATPTDPLYPWQDYDFPVYTMTDGTRTVEFAAGEMSNTVWGFFQREG
jgi:hypothetical protein